MVQQKYLSLLGVFLLSLMLYAWVGYGIERGDFALLMGSFGALFVAYYFLVRGFMDSTVPVKWGIFLALAFRLVLLLAIPNLSDDFYRFIWDGNLLASGINPFLETPQFYAESDRLTRLGISGRLYEGLNSASYYTIYPPVGQYVFWLGARLFQDQILANVILMRTVVMAAEAGTILILVKLLRRLKLNPAYALIYAFNPLVIIELSGNLHFEGVMIFFLVSAYYLFIQKRYWLAGALFVMAVNTKLMPLLLLPYLVFSLGWRKSAGLGFLLAAGTLLMHLPFLEPAFLSNFSESLGLYFQSFEFNASIYYLVRWLGFQMEGYNIIGQAGPFLAIVATVLIIVVSWLFRHRKLGNLPLLYIAVLTIYYLFSTTVHPWYLTSLLAFVPMAGMLYPLVWSALVPLSYAAYMTSAYTENLWLVALEYLVMIGALAYELHREKGHPSKKFHRMFFTER